MFNRRLKAILTALALAPITSGLTHAAPAIPTLSITAREYRYDAPTTVRSGYTRVVLRNLGKSEHDVKLYRLKKPVALPQLVTALENVMRSQGDNMGPLLELVDGYGGTPETASGGTGEVVLNLDPGEYVLGTWDSDGNRQRPTSAAKLGMIRRLTVVPSIKMNAQPPRADYRLRLLDFSFDFPARVTAGHHLWEIRNDGRQPHFVSLLPLKPGKTMRDVAAFMQSGGKGNPPVVFPEPASKATESATLTPSRVNFVSFDLAPGQYLAVCFITDPQSHKSHAELGMMQLVTVTAR